MFLLFLTRKKVPRAFSASERCCSANSDTRCPLANRPMLQNSSEEEKMKPPEMVKIFPCEFIRLYSSVEICTSASAAPLGDFCKEMWCPQDFRGEFLLCFCSLLFWVCLLAPSPLIWDQPEYFHSFVLSLSCLLFLLHRLRALKPLQERRYTTLEDENLAWALKAVSTQPLFHRGK